MGAVLFLGGVEAVSVDPVGHNLGPSEEEFLDLVHRLAVGVGVGLGGDFSDDFDHWGVPSLSLF